MCDSFITQICYALYWQFFHLLMPVYSWIIQTTFIIVISKIIQILKSDLLSLLIHWCLWTILWNKIFTWALQDTRASQVEVVVKNPPTNAGDIRDMGSILGSGRSPGGGHGNPFQYSCLQNPMDRGAWQATVQRVAQSQTWLKQLSMHAHRGAQDDARFTFKNL